MTIMTNKISLGIDFGTTSLSAVIYDNVHKKVLHTFSIPTKAYLKTDNSLFAEQDIQVIRQCLNEITVQILACGISIDSIGLTGQMHGIIGLNREGEAITNLVTWQDRRGSLKISDGLTLLKEMKEKVPGLSVSDGYGLVTLYYWKNIEKKENIFSFCTLPDFFAMQLCHLSVPVMHASMAHSIGGFNLFPVEGWNKETITVLNLQEIKFPEIYETNYTAGNSDLFGRLPEEIPVRVALGDNQASYIGSVGNYLGALLINVGTGTQLSYTLPKEKASQIKKEADTEIRPYMTNQVLISTSLISGGNVYATLYDFFMKCGVQLFGLNNEAFEKSVYKKMEQTARNEISENKPEIFPLLFASRNDPDSKAVIQNLTKDNFTPGSFVLGFLSGMAVYYKSKVESEVIKNGKKIFGSGNGIKYNALFREILEKEFGSPLEMTIYNEEAATGAAISTSMQARQY